MSDKETTTFEQTFPAEISELDSATAFIESLLEMKGCPIKTQTRLMIAFEEIFVNVAHYSGSPDVSVHCEFSSEPEAVKITFRDSGLAFNPLEAKDPDVTLPAEERKIGGLGIYMVKQSMDQVDYRRDGQVNELTIYKKF